MVANVQIKNPKIYTGEAPVEELQRKLIEERRELSKAAALELGCSVEEVKFTINNLGVYCFARMTPQEMIDMSAQDARQKKVVQIKKDRGVFDE